MTDEIRTEEPHDRLTRICATMTDTMDEHPEKLEDDKCMVFLHGDGVSGIVLHGYDDDTEAMVDLIIHLKAIFKANGKEFMIMPVGEG